MTHTARLVPLIHPRKIQQTHVIQLRNGSFIQTTESGHAFGTLKLVRFVVLLGTQHQWLIQEFGRGGD